jgi:hypothetical protein
MLLLSVHREKKKKRREMHKSQIKEDGKRKK